MILCVSRNFDIIDKYPKWFMERLQEGFFDVSNKNSDTANRHLINKETVDGIVLWTKNLNNFIEYLPEFINMGFPHKIVCEFIPYDFFAINTHEIIKSIKTASQITGKKHIIWKYSPVLLTPIVSVKTHLMQFNMIASALSKIIEKCIIGGVTDNYVYRQNQKILAKDISADEQNMLIDGFCKIGTKYNIEIQFCHTFNPSNTAMQHKSCISTEFIRETGKIPITEIRDEKCLCAKTLDMGAGAINSNYLYNNKHSTTITGILPLKIKVVKPTLDFRTQLSFYDIAYTQ